MYYSLNSFKSGYIWDYIAEHIGVTKRDTRSLDYSSYSTYYPYNIFPYSLPTPGKSSYAGIWCALACQQVQGFGVQNAVL